MTNPSIPSGQSVQPDKPELPSSSVKAAVPKGIQPAGDAKPPNTEVKAASPNGSVVSPQRSRVSRSSLTLHDTRHNRV